MKKTFLIITILFSYSISCHGQIFNNHIKDCPTATAKLSNEINRGCWSTYIEEIELGQEIIVGIYFHNTSFLDANILVQLTDPRSGSGDYVILQGKIIPDNGKGAEGRVKLSFSQKAGLIYLYTQVYFNGFDDASGGVITDKNGRVFDEGEPVFVPSVCAKCDDSFLYQGVVKIHFKVVNKDLTDIYKSPKSIFKKEDTIEVKYKKTKFILPIGVGREPIKIKNSNQ